MSAANTGLFDTAIGYAMDAVWSSNPARQIAVNAVIIVAAMLSSSVGFLPGLVIAAFAIVFLLVGVARLLYGLVR